MPHGQRVSVDSSRRQEILESTISLLAEHGYDKLTSDALAKAAKTSKATRYRHWSSKLELAVEAMKDLVDQQPRIDSETLRQDLINTVLASRSVFQLTPLAAFNATVAAIPQEPHSAHAFVRIFLNENPPLTALWGELSRAARSLPTPTSISQLRRSSMACITSPCSESSR
nr:helix-turn-helix domain-containing protein [uncultured Nocardioides sp.]